MQDDVVSRAMVTYNGSVNWPPKPLEVSKKTLPKQAAAVDSTTPIKEDKKSNGWGSLISLGVIAVILYLLALVAPPEFMQHFTVFVLSIFIGWQVIWNVSHSLHTPLMAVTNAISGIIIIGGLLQTRDNFGDMMTILAVIAILVASINIVGGFVVTHRMLKMFRK